MRTRRNFLSAGATLGVAGLAHQLLPPWAQSAGGSAATGLTTLSGKEFDLEIGHADITIDGKRTLPCEIARMKTTGRRDDEGNSWFEVKLREGRTQQIRKMFQAVGHPVSKLRRVAIGPISDPRLTPGDWRELSKNEVKMLSTMQEPKAKAKPRRAPARPASKKKTAAASKKRRTTTKRVARRGRG